MRPLKMIGREFNSLIELLSAFRTEQSCLNYLEKMRWDGNVVSPYDPASKVYKCKNNRYRCKNTGLYFTVKTGTILEGTKVELKKWFVAVWILSSNRKGLSSYQLAREIGVSQKTAWYMCHRIRECFFLDENEEKLSGEVACDEAFVGGKNKNRHRDKKYPKCRGRSFKDKGVVLGMLEKGGRIIAKVIPNTQQNTITPMLLRYVDRSAILHTDEWHGYNQAGQIYDRKFVDHGRKQYAVDGVSTNGVENFWSILKRGVIGVYHRTSKKHLQRYVDEYVFRFNHRKISDGWKFNLVLQNLDKRIRYRDLVYVGR